MPLDLRTMARWGESKGTGLGEEQCSPRQGFLSLSPNQSSFKLQQSSAELEPAKENLEGKGKPNKHVDGWGLMHSSLPDLGSHHKLTPNPFHSNDFCHFCLVQGCLLYPLSWNGCYLTQTQVISSTHLRPQQTLPIDLVFFP